MNQKLDLLFAVLVVGAALLGVVWVTPTNEARILNLGRLTVLLLLVGGVGLIWRGVRHRSSIGWPAAEGMIASGVLLLVVTGDHLRVMARRAAGAAGYLNAQTVDYSTLRVITSFVMACASLWVLRWLTEPAVGAWGWAAAMLAWIAVAMIFDGYLGGALTWLYLHLLQPPSP